MTKYLLQVVDPCLAVLHISILVTGSKENLESGTVLTSSPRSAGSPHAASTVARLRLKCPRRPSLLREVMVAAGGSRRRDWAR